MIMLGKITLELEQLVVGVGVCVVSASTLRQELGRWLDMDRILSVMLHELVMG